MYICKECDWVGEYPFSDRNGDSYDPETTWVDLCPLCFTIVKEEENE